MTRKPLQLTDAQLEAYRRDGFIVVENLLTPEEVAYVLTIDDAPMHAAGLLGHTVDPVFGFVAHHPNVAGVAMQLLDSPARIVQTMYLAKAPQGGTGLALHQDRHYLDNDPDTLMACWIAVTDTSEENGGLCVIPGSHLTGLRTTHANQNTQEHDAWTYDYPMRDRDGREYTIPMSSFEIDDIDPAAVKHLTVPAGGGVFFTGLTIHGSYANHSLDKPRKAFATHYVAEGTFLPRVDVQDTVAVELGAFAPVGV